MSTPLFIEDAASVSQGRFMSLLRQVSGPYNGTRHFSETRTISGAVTLASADGLKPLELAIVVGLMTLHPLIVWNKLKYAVLPGPGSFGRAVTVHFGWVPPGRLEPTTAAQFAALPGYTFQVFGGMADPSYTGVWLDAPFNEMRHAVVASGLFHITTPMKMMWYVETSNIGTALGAGPQAFIRFEGEFGVYGQYY